jgi:hypothetical protein
MGLDEVLNVSNTTTNTIKITNTTDTALDVTGGASIQSNLKVGTSNLFVDTVTGNVGIGTTTPGFSLDVHGTANVGALAVTSVSGSGSGLTALNADNISSGTLTRPVNTTTVTIDDYLIHDGDADTKIGFPATDTFTVTTANSERMRVDSSGNVGIGVATPSYKLAIQDGNNNGADVTLTRLYSQANASGVSSTGLRLEKGVGYGGVVKGYISQGVGSGLSLHTLNGGTELQVMTLRNDGNVGIGTASPDTNLHIYGDTNQTNIYLGEDGTPDKAGIIKYFQGDGSGTGTLHLGHWGDNFSSTQTLCIKKGGNVGIGVANPAVKLDVNGSASLRSQPCVIAYPNIAKVYNANSSENIIFGGTLLNRGSMYNASNGVITIPEDGVYYFHTHMYMQASHTGIFDLYKKANGTSTWLRITRGECNTACGDNTLVTLMSTQLCNTGDKFKYVKNNGTDVEQIVHSGTGQYFQNMACYKVG